MQVSMPRKITKSITLQKSRKKNQKYHGEVVDLFCGVGALSHGLRAFRPQRSSLVTILTLDASMRSKKTTAPRSTRATLQNLRQRKSEDTFLAKYRRYLPDVRRANHSRHTNNDTTKTRNGVSWPNLPRWLLKLNQIT